MDNDRYQRRGFIPPLKSSTVFPLPDESIVDAVTSEISRNRNERITMAHDDEKLRHYGPEPHYGFGPEMVHKLVHEHAIGKTITAVYLGDAEPIPGHDPKDHAPDGVFRGEYVAFEFSDETSLVLEIAAGNSFWVAGEREAAKVLARTKEAARNRG